MLQYMTQSLQIVKRSCYCITGRLKAVGSSPQPVLDFPTLPSLALNTAPLQPVPPQPQPAAGVSEAPTTSSTEEASARRPKDEPLLLINPAQLSRSSSHVMPSPRVMQPDADPASALDTGASTHASAAVSAVEGFPMVEGYIAEVPGSLVSAQRGPSTAAAGLTPQDLGNNDLLAAVNAVAGGLSLHHTASQSSYARLPSIREEASAGAYGSTAVLSAPQQSDAAMSEPSLGVIFTAAAPGFRRTTSNLRTGGSLTASTAADLPSLALLSGQVYRRTTHDEQLSAYGIQGMVSSIHAAKASGCCIALFALTIGTAS